MNLVFIIFGIGGLFMGSRLGTYLIIISIILGFQNWKLLRKLKSN